MKSKKAVTYSYYYDGRKKVFRKERIMSLPCKPTKKAVLKKIEEWEQLDNYREQEQALDKLFLQLCPNNDNLEDILIKVCSLNDFYSTNIFNVFEVANVIMELKIDQRLQTEAPDTELVDTIANALKENAGKYYFSFASKYCSHHKPELYPIYDSYVDMLLRYYRNEVKDDSFSFKDKELQQYSSFYKIVEQFKEHYGLNSFSAKEIDKFLWQEGKRCFPKWIEIKA